MELTELEKQILLLMKEKRRLPIVRFELHSSKDAELACTALNYVWITDPEDSMATVKERGAALESLMKKALVFIDYSVRIWVVGDYKIYYQSKLYETLCHMAMENAKNPEALFDIPGFRKGYARLAWRGELAAVDLGE